jgi:hypothetical protein
MNFTPATFSVKLIGQTPIRLTTAYTGSCSRVDIKAFSTNGNLVYVWFSSWVTPGTVSATDGFQLAAKDGVSYNIDDPSIIYLVSDSASANQSVSVNIIP